MSSLGNATLLGGVLAGVPMNATSAMTDLNKEGVKGDSLTARYTVVIITLLHLGMWLELQVTPCTWGLSAGSMSCHVYWLWQYCLTSHECWHFRHRHKITIILQDRLPLFHQVVIQWKMFWDVLAGHCFLIQDSLEERISESAWSLKHY